MFKRIWNAIRGSVKNTYEAARWTWGDRSWIPATVQDMRFDADAATRLEILRKSRYFERNNAICNRLGDLFEQFTVGPKGLQVVPTSSTDDWNTSASDWWNVWCKYPDLVSRQPFGVLQGLMARSWFFDGEVFVWKTFSPESGKPRVQLIEGHRIFTPTDKKKEEGKTVIDGVQINASGRPIDYYVCNSQDTQRPGTGQTFQIIPADHIVHLFEPSRPGQMRGLPFLYPVINDLHDLDDLQKYQMQKSKTAAGVDLVVTNATGEASTTAMRRQRFNVASQNQAGAVVTKQPDIFYDVKTGTTTRYLKTGEDMKVFKNDDPSVAVRDYWDHIIAKVCAGVGISRLLVLPYSMQGTVTRADLDVANAFFRSRSAVIATAILDIYQWVIGWAKDFDRQLDGAPKGDWANAIVRPPRAVNVDVGRNSAAMIAELQAGTRTYQDIYAESGEDWREQIEQKAKEQAFIQMLAAKYKIEAPLIAAPAQTATAAPEPETDGGAVPVKTAD